MHLVWSIAALVLEVAGLALILRETMRPRRDELGHVGALRRLWQEVQATWHNPAPIVKSGGARLFAGGGATASGHKVATDPIERLGQRLYVLERRVSEQNASEQRHAEMTTRTNDLAGDLAGRIDSLETTRKAGLARSSRNERAGVFLFGLGLVAGFLANIT